MEIQRLPIFNELIEIICNYRIESWEISDFWNEIKLLKVSDNDVNYQGLYRLVLRLVKEGYLIIDIEKSKGNNTAYTQSEKLQELRLQFYNISTSNFRELILERENIRSECTNLEEEIIALEELRLPFIGMQLQIEQLKQTKTETILSLKVKIRALNSLIQYFK